MCVCIMYVDGAAFPSFAFGGGGLFFNDTDLLIITVNWWCVYPLVLYTCGTSILRTVCEYPPVLYTQTSFIGCDKCRSIVVNYGGC